MNAAFGLWIWYYFNILAAAGIVFYLLEIMRQRSMRAIINTAEKPFKPDNTMFKRIFFLAILAIIFFLAREYKLDAPLIWAWDKFVILWLWMQGFIGGMYHG